MSNTIDEKVVEMKFDNKNFETNVKTTMTSLDRLKEKLQLRGSEKSFQAIDSAAKSVSFDSLISNVEYLRKRFSVMGIAGMQVVQNLTNTVMTSVTKAKNFVEQAISGGGLSRAMKLDQANFKLMGLLQDDAKQVAAIMDDVDYGVSGTAYSLDAAASVAAQLAASGMRAGDGMQHALRGISGVAAMTGSTYEDIGRIYTQIAGQGRMMGDQLLQLSGRGMNAAATLAKYLNTTEAEVRDMVSKGKIDFQTFADIMDQEYGEHAKKANETFEGAFANVKSALAKIGANFYKPLIEQNGPLVGILNTVRLKINDIKEITLPFVESASKGVAKLINYANKLVEKINVKTLFGGLTSKWDNLMNKIGEAGVTEETFTEKLKEVAKEQGINIEALLKKYGSLANIFAKGKLSGGLIIDTLKCLTNVTSKASESTQDITDKVEYFNDVVSKTIRGDFGNGEERIKALTAANYDYAQVQALVNKVWERNGHNWSDCTLSADELTEAMAGLSDKEAETLGLTKDQIKTLRDLAIQAEKTGTPISELIASLNKPSGKELLIESFQNAVKGATQVAKVFKQAYSEMFTTSDKSGESTLYRITETVNKFSQHLVMSDEKADKLKRTLKGLFALIDMISNIVGGGLKLGLKLINTLLKYFNLDLLTVTAYIGDFLVKLRDVTDFSKLFSKALDKVSPYLRKFSDGFKDWIQGLKDADNIPKYILEGLVNGLKNGGKEVVDTIIQIGKDMLSGIKSVLGIHSPSVEFYKVGDFSMTGWFNGIQNGVSKLLELIKSIGSGILDAVKGIDFGKVLAVGLGAGLIYVTNNVTKAVTSFSEAIEAVAAPAKGLGKLLESVGGFFTELGTNIKKYLRVKEIQVIASSVLELALAVGVLSGALWIVSNIPEDRLWSSIGAIATLSGIVAGLAVAITVLGKIGGGAKGALTVVGVCTALLLATIALKKLQDLDPEKMGPIVDALGDLLIKLGIVCGALMVVSKLSKSTDQAGNLLLKMSVSLLIIAKAITALAKLTPEGVLQGVIVIELVQGLFTKIVAISIFAGKYADEAGNMLIKMGVAMAIMVGVVKLASKLDGDEVLNGIAVIGLITLLFEAIIIVSQTAGEYGSKAGAMLLGMSIAIGVLVGVIKLISYLDDAEVKRGLKIIGVIEVMFSAIIAVSHFAGENVAKAGAMLLMMSGALLIITGVIFILTQIDPDALPRATLVVSILETLFGGLIYVSRYAENVKKGTIISMTVAIGVLVAAVVGLTFLDPSKLAVATTCISALMVSFGAMMALTKFSKNTKQLRGTMIQMLGVVVVLGGVIAAMSMLNTDNAIQSSAALSLLLLSFSTAFAIMGKSGRISKTVTDNLYTMAGVVGVLALILGAMAALNIEASISNAIALSVVLNAMASAMLMLGLVKTVPTTAIGAMALMGLVVGELGVILGLLNKYDLNASISTATALSILLVAMSVAMIPLALIGTGALAAIVGVTAMIAIVTEIGLFIAALGALSSEYPELQDFLDKGIPLLSAIGEGIGEFFGSIVSGFVSSVADVLPDIGTKLSEFATNISPFITTMTQVDKTAMEGAKALAETLLLLTAASLLDSLTKFLGGGVDYSQLALDLAAYGNAVVAFSNATKGKVDGDSVTVAANAGKVLAELQKSIPRSGGWAQKIMGEKDMSAFSDGITAFGDAIVAFSNTIVQNGGIDKDAVDNAAKCGEIMAALNDKIPAQGGVWQCFIGEKNLSTFGSNIKDFGNAMVEFSNIVAGKTDKGSLDKDAVKKAKILGEMMISLNEAVPEQGGFMSWIAGSTDLDDFGENIVAFGSALVDFSNNVSGKISDDAVNAADNAGQMMVNLQKQISGLNDDSFDCLDSLGSALETWGSHLSNYSANISGIDTAQLGTVTDEISTLYSFVSQMTSFDASGLSQFTASLNNIGTISLDNFVSAFGDAGEKASSVITTFIDNMVGKVDGRKQKWETSGRNAMIAYKKGIGDKKEEVSSTASDIAQTSIDKISDYRNNFYNVGQYLIEGMANGIDDASNKAVLAVRRMAKKLPQIAKIILQIHSPSKVFDKLGGYVPEGFAGGVTRGSKAVYDTIKTMSNTVIDKAGSMMSLISDVLSLDLDYEPTITPVVDMSEVTGSMDTINSMLNKNPLMFTGVSTNAMNSIVKHRNNQNGNSDVIEAIDRLAKNINQTPGNTYNVNGITYDDGSNIASAVEQIVRAAMIGRRV
nr:MAG TPA: tail tape measure [Caudoviricetes sp.]